MRQVRLLVTDLDNTLYDWVSFFVPSFYAMIEEATRLLSVERDQLLDEIRDVHKRYGSSEQPFALLDVPIVAERYPSLSRAEVAAKLDPAFHAFNRVRKETLQLYPGVLETLREVRTRGAVVVAHTEAPVANAIFRLQMLGVSEFITALYAPADKGPGHPNPDRIVTGMPSHYVHRLEAGTRKPSPEILARILEESHVSSTDALYVGDSITRDISMARLAGTQSALATYGRRFDPKLWEQLVRVTHWTDEDVRREAELREEFASVRADVELETFGDVLRHFEFGPP